MPLFRLLRIAGLLAATLIANSGWAQDAKPESSLDSTHVLVPGDGLSWKLVDTTSGKEKPLILPAFHPEQSHPIISGNRLAYIGLTKHGERQQLGCITYDIAKGRVLNRKDSSLFARDDMPLTPPELRDDDSVSCVLKGEQCRNKDQGPCSVGEETVSLNFEPGAVARKELKNARHNAKSAKAAHGTKGAKGRKALAAKRHGAVKAGSKAAKAKPHAKTARKSASKTPAKKVRHS